MANMLDKFQTYLAHVRINTLEPITELLILLGILPEVVQGVTNDTHAHAVREPLEKGPELAGGLVERAIAGQCLMRVLAMASDGMSVLGILLNEVNQPTDGLLVVLVLLAFNDDFLAAVDELIAPLLGEVLLTEEILRPIVVLIRLVLVLVRTILVFLGNAI